MENARVEIPCTVCGPGAGYRVRYPERVGQGAFDFKARKVPTREHFRIVDCTGCGLVYSNPIATPETIEALYRRSPFILEPQIENMRRDYENEVRDILPFLSRREAFLEVGCSNGFFLESALRMGFSIVRGVEPGQDAVRRAPPAVRSLIANALFSAELFPPGSFDLICGFQILDHLLDPDGWMKTVQRLLRPGGLVLLLNHNIRSWFPRLLGERSPMYDIEHIYLFDKQTVTRLLRKHSFDVLRARNIPNSYTLSYAVKMFPLPAKLKRASLSLLEKKRVAAWRIRLPAGNMTAVGLKPRE